MGQNRTEDVEYRLTGDVGRIRLTRPEKKNAITAAMREDIASALNRFSDGDGSVLVITGSEDAFCAGTDIGELETRRPETLDDALALDEFGLPERIEEIELPTVAMINGIAVGGGLELALGCDIRIASSEATLGFPEISLGGFPAEGGTQRLPRETNMGTALYYILSGELVSADRARKDGLVQAVHPPETLEERTMEFAQKIAAHDQIGLRFAKRATKMAERTEFDQGLALEGTLAKVLEATGARKEQLNDFFAN
jgi:enoyl-CoA hydratase/carnithine racemase